MKRIEDYKSLPDEKLALLVGKGETEALGELFERHHNRVFNHSLRIVGNEEDASDIVQETFEYLLGHLVTYEPRAKFTTYLFTITHGLSLRKLRGRKGCSLEDLEREAESFEPIAPATRRPGVDETIRARIDEAMEKLPPLQQEILFLRFKLDLSYDEISKVLSIPVGTVKSRMNASVGNLRSRYRPEAAS